MSRTLPVLCIVLALLLPGCAPREPRPPPSGTGLVPPEFPVQLYEQAAARGEPVYRIDPMASEIRILVFRGGALARLGHNHVIVSRDVQGYILLDKILARQRADLYVPVARLIVDDPVARGGAGEGFDYVLEPQAVESTAANMLGEEVLDAQRYPFITIHARPIDHPCAAAVRLRVDLTLHGVTRAFELTAHTDRSADGLLVSGALELRQSDFGITPFAVLGGALRVQDRLVLRYRLLARPDQGFAGSAS